MNTQEIIKTLSTKEKKILKLITRNNNLPRTSIRKLAKLKTGNFYDIIESLLNKKLILSSPQEDTSKKGRPSDILSINSKFGYFYYILLTRYDCHFAILDFNGNSIKEYSFDISSNYFLKDFKSDILKYYRKLIEDLKINEKSIIQFCFVSGIINLSTDISEGYIRDKNWIDFKIADYISENLSLKTTFLPIANAASYGKFIEQYKEKTSSMGFFILGDGVGLSIINNNKIIELITGAPIGLTHLVINPSGKLCECGKHGCLQTEICPKYIIQNTKAELSMGINSTLSNKIDNLSLMDINNAAASGDNFAINIISTLAATFSLVVRNLLTFYKPDYLLLGGKLISRMPAFYTEVKNIFTKDYPNLNIIKNTTFIEDTKYGISVRSIEEIANI